MISEWLKCAVGLGGDKLYITIANKNTLLTLSIDGTVMSTFTDPQLRSPRGLHVTHSGQVLVCGWRSSTVIQVNAEGNTKIATLVTQKHGMKYPLSVSCKKNDTIIVGQWQNSNMLLFEVK
ncbi:hypothetical protein DPMN_088520 [Dreissena polymorpha]|uniref:Uncharacterized protein n=1 Tax=Dreissena polymorpha TaxID=45954 RepID=A0A9D4KWC1_DREPO|nr:hypothetical protein DPMN_088520 [Dreissena polymorpha]